MLRITFNDKVLNNRRHHQRRTAQEEIARQKDHIVEGVLVRNAKDHGTDDNQHNWENQIWQLILGLTNASTTPGDPIVDLIGERSTDHEDEGGGQNLR